MLPLRRPNGLRVLDLCCGAGGLSMGYYLAGFDVTGVDNRPQPNYPFTFHQADALTFPLDGFDLVHASWPCERYARVTAWRGNPNDHPDLLAVGRERLAASGLPHVMENVPEAPLRPDYLLCGTQFGLNVRRHRSFETSWGERAYADAMGCTWMTNKEARKAVPPAYTRHIATQWLSLERSAAA